MKKNAVYRRETEVLAQLLYERRTAQRLSQADVARAVSRPQTFISDLERERRAATFVSVLDMLKALNYDPHDFLDDFLERLGKNPVKPPRKSRGA
jgi:transcriptional regulator with XRE-family HTH domain